ncbi:hypothetical protein R8Z50_05465 [Longispora sp. K20-0274]|uniref:HIT family protein n=1 Tax=Longispora sp. K20-0274 TaxID=3088255 RepID=UPI00399AFF63
MSETPTPSAYVQRLPIGEPIPFPEDGIPNWDIFPFEGDLQVKVLEAPELPEPPRHGEVPADCRCATGLPDNTIWSDDNWVVLRMWEAHSLPAIVILKPIAHHDLDDLPPHLSAELGPVMQRVEKAIMGLGGIARVHVNKWGDGGAHLHWWFFGRPEGMVQLRGTCLPLWDDVLPRVPVEEWTETNRKIAAALAVDGGHAHI